MRAAFHGRRSTGDTPGVFLMLSLLIPLALFGFFGSIWVALVSVAGVMLSLLISLALFGFFGSIWVALVSLACASLCRKPGVRWIEAVFGLNVLSRPDLYTEGGQSWRRLYQQCHWVAAGSATIAAVALVALLLLEKFGRGR